MSARARALSLWAIHHNPLDVPTGCLPEVFVARRHEVKQDGTQSVGERSAVCATLDECRQAVFTEATLYYGKSSMMLCPRHPADDLTIVEVWI